MLEKNIKLFTNPEKEHFEDWLHELIIQLRENDKNPNPEEILTEVYISSHGQMDVTT